MKQFLLTLPRNVVGSFRGWKLIGHILAIVLTFVLVVSDFDWSWFCATRSPALQQWMFPAVIIGQLLPVTLPLLLLLIGKLFEKSTAARTGWAIGQAVLIGWFIGAACKAVTGRQHPPHSLSVDTSHAFHFGFGRGGIFWGWPSSHTLTTFAMAIALCTLFPHKLWLRAAAIAYAFYIGIGVSITIHWFSDFVAGAIIGTLVGLTVGKSFSPVNATPPPR